MSRELKLYDVFFYESWRGSLVVGFVSRVKKFDLSVIWLVDSCEHFSSISEISKTSVVAKTAILLT